MISALVLEDGTVVKGEGFGAKGITYGELVFNTSMTGYQEALTDPSYEGQLLMFTYPLIGNYGINSQDFESDGIRVRGMVVREHCEHPSHRLSNKNLAEFLKQQAIPAISGVDTRTLTIKIRRWGTVKAALVSQLEEIEPQAILEKVKAMPHPMEENLVSKVSCGRIIKHEYGENKRKEKPRVVLIDCGVKRSIIKAFLPYCELIQVPYTVSIEKIKALNPKGIVISNGPGDPSHPSLLPLIELIKKLKEDFPLMGICLGHQLLSIAFGAKTSKLKFGHRGANQPVKDLRKSKTFITAQNHGYAVNATSMEDLDIEVTQINLNDGTVEGMKHKELPICSVQYHPEAHPGPRDTEHLFEEFINRMG
jgi:carbamoyl-phosphate synthase small subunit